ncbi:MAG TPA: stalk domain-containing protein [Caldisericia bacterium]|nr:stalk domain-containing protein [Caldisericia bacterium]HPB34415.1 stalk domain-containing protein [Caldisericia bacterium]HQL67061.1 stalk domain-containing protein [Caldisericia bacterium]HQN48537.1 stalk domain-containing protein [Caldisericia bacterium]HQP00089.1 stalk domain-containing protein [Caldisericia bacterium]
MSKKTIILITLIISILTINNLYSLNLLEKPINLTATQEDYKVRLTWQLSKSDDNISGFEVFRGESEKSLNSIGRAFKDQLYFLDYNIYLDKTYYYMVKSYDKDGNYSEPSNIISIKIIDNKPPELQIIEPTDNNYYTKEEKLTLLIGVKDNMSGLNSLLVNGVKINKCGCSTFTADYTLVEGKNEFLIEAEDYKGNKSSLTLIVFLDKTPPKLNVNLPINSYDENLKVKGKIIDEGIGLKTGYLNNIELMVDKNGNFETYLLLKEGENELKFRLIDKLDNEKEETYKINYIKRTVLKLQIGNKTMYINNSPKEIDVLPIIIEGRTFIPIRWVAEPLGAEVGWDGVESKVTVTLKDTKIELWIGKSIARVNGVDTPIDPDNPKVVPMIISGRTMLPVRFVAENLGCKVDWNPDTKTVTITYPKD